MTSPVELPEGFDPPYPLITNQLLYQLSYGSIYSAVVLPNPAQPNFTATERKKYGKRK